MTGTGAKLTQAVEAYFADLGRIRGSGGATGELSYPPALRNLLNAVGAALRSKVFCVGELADAGPVPRRRTRLLGGYQVLKKWLSYRERDILGRTLKPEEVQFFADTARRIGGILLATSTDREG